VREWSVAGGGGGDGEGAGGRGCVSSVEELDSRRFVAAVASSLNFPSLASVSSSRLWTQSMSIAASVMASFASRSSVLRLLFSPPSHPILKATPQPAPSLLYPLSVIPTRTRSKRVFVHTLLRLESQDKISKLGGDTIYQEGIRTREKKLESRI
jgi:hypothetical protein